MRVMYKCSEVTMTEISMNENVGKDPEVSVYLIGKENMSIDTQHRPHSILGSTVPRL